MYPLSGKASQRIGRSGMRQLHAKACADNDLLVWTIYDHPIDYPESFVVRPYSTRLRIPLTVHFQAPELSKARAALNAMGLVPVLRSSNDDLKIIETWL